MDGVRKNGRFSPDPRASFGEVVEHARQLFIGRGVQSTARRNYIYRFWAEQVGSKRAVAELDHFIASYSSRAEAARAAAMSVSTLRRLRRLFKAMEIEPEIPVPLALSGGEQLQGAKDAYVVEASRGPDGVSIGSGGMGVVYRVLTTAGGRKLAAKVLSSTRFLINNTVRARFRRECDIARDFDSHFLVRSIECIEHRGTLVSVMERLPGDNVAHALRGTSEYGFHTRQGWVRDIATGLALLHGKQIVHRDLAPKNCLFREDGRVAVADFGVARRVDDHTLTTSVEQMGSLLYISAEQRDSPHSATFVDDVYSLGQVAYHILTGRSPLGGGDQVARAGHGQEWNHWVERARHADPSRRFASGQEALESLPA